MGVYEVQTEDGTYEVEVDDSDAPSSAVPTNTVRPEDSPGTLASIWSDVKSTPKMAFDMVKSIPSGISNIYQDIRHPVDSFNNGTLERTVRGVGDIASFMAAGPFGKLAFDKINQATGSDAPTTMTEDLRNLQRNTIQNAIFGGVAKGVAKGSGALAEAIAPATKVEEAIQGLGINPSDVKKAAKYKAPGPNGESPINQALSGATERGLFDGEAAPESLFTKNKAIIKDLADQNSTILSEADTAPSAKSVALETPQAKKFISESTFDKGALQTQLENRLADIEGSWDGSLGQLNQIKSELGGRAYVNTTESRALDQALYRDLRATVEKGAEQSLGAEKVAQIKKLNSQMSEHFTLAPIIEKAKNKVIAAELKPQQSGFINGMDKLFGDVARGGVLGGGAAYLTGVPGLTPLGLGLGLAKAGLQTRMGQAATSGLMDIFSTAASSPAARAAVPSIFTPTKPGPGLFPKNEASPMQNESPAIPKLHPAVEELAPALVKQESAGNADAVSPKGATGLWQVMPDTAKDIAKELGVSNYDLKDPATSELFGKFYLSKMLNKFDGDKELALAAYNAGPQKVAQWINEFKSSDWKMIAARLAALGKYKETRDYVSRILKNSRAMA